MSCPPDAPAESRFMLTVTPLGAIELTLSAGTHHAVMTLQGRQARQIAAALVAAADHSDAMTINRGGLQ